MENSKGNNYDYTIAVDYQGDWVRCNCGRALFWVSIAYGVVNIKCPSCGKVVRVVLGVMIKERLDNVEQT